MTVKLDRRHFLRAGAGVAALAPVAGAVGSLASSQAVAQAPNLPAGIYGPGPDVARLDANENPYGPSPAALKAIAESSQYGAYYVRQSIGYLTDMIAERHGLQAEQILLSSGSSGVLTWAAMAAASKGKILGPDLFWDTTALAPERAGMKSMIRAPKTADLAIDLDAIYDLIDDDVAMVQITNPNNPTGLLLDPDKLREFCKKASKKTLVLVDEAYNELSEFTEKNSMVGLVKQGYNVMVARTFSKIYGLAGMRVGYMMASPANLEFISGFGAGYFTLNQTGIAAAIASYNDFKFLDFVRARIRESKDLVTQAVKAQGLTALPSATNFMFVNLGTGNAETFRAHMAEEQVFIRGIYRDYTSWSRVSLASPETMQKYVKALPKALDKTL